ncbi:hypothetical protein H8B02_22830 [Bradyrhizobium sp. Pear77]|uniref:hypothetical protein n=1 Tax=Bradyrhizobium altum TaxID=1571202 RepID=UPI001E4E29E0|nr:hypothetical protein [Bradyrhizobium altum]MCC8956159.1 hypothetical protein [Bradyrhizobium altum]
MAFPNSVFWHRARRAIASGSPVLLASGLVIAGFAATNVKAGLGLGNALVWGVLVLAILLLLFQMRAEYRKRTYDPTWVLKFVDYFHEDTMRSVRCHASDYLKTNAAQVANCESTDIDDLLDFFDQVGFYLQGDQITAEAAHHAFHHWIRGYWSAARDYVRAKQNDEPCLWEFVEVVFDMTDQIERERSKGTGVGLLDKEGIAMFLDEEIESTCGSNDEDQADDSAVQ